MNNAHSSNTPARLGRPMYSALGPRGCHLLLENSDDLPLVSFQAAITVGGAHDPIDTEGFAHHLASLSRRGAGTRDRLQLDTALDTLGASLECWAQRDAIKLSGLCLERNIDQLIELATDVLSTPHMHQQEHEKLLRETRMSLDEVRDDDAQIAARFFHRHCVPGHPYARALRGTETSLDAIKLAQIRAAHRQWVVPENLIVGFAGAVDQADAERYSARLVADLPQRHPHGAQATPRAIPPMPRGRRLLVIDKPERTQSQIVIGHQGPRYGHEDTPAFLLVSAIFGGMFTSRLMQEIRVKRGWSYGADCHWYRSQAPHWFNIQLAPPAEVTADALELTLAMFERLVQHGVTADELAFAKRFLTGNLPFQLSTARRRLERSVTGQIFGLPGDFIHTLTTKIDAVEVAQANRVARRWLLPDDAICVVVATADRVLPSLERLRFPTTELIPYDSY